jgi:hypothetical protein
MDKTTIITSTVSLLGGGLIVYLFEFFAKRGKIVVDSYSLTLTHLHTSDYKQFVIIKFELDIQFINSSGYSKIVNNLTAKFFDSQNIHTLQFYGHNVPPAAVIEAKQTECLQFDLVAKQHNFYCPAKPQDFYVEVDFNINGKAEKLKITTEKMELKDETFTAMIS